MVVCVGSFLFFIGAVDAPSCDLIDDVGSMWAIQDNQIFKRYSEVG